MVINNRGWGSEEGEGAGGMERWRSGVTMVHVSKKTKF
jgi:hypothetical protein